MSGCELRLQLMCCARILSCTRYLRRVELRMYGVEIGRVPPPQRDIELRVELIMEDWSEADEVAE